METKISLKLVAAEWNPESNQGRWTNGMYPAGVWIQLGSGRGGGKICCSSSAAVPRRCHHSRSSLSSDLRVAIPAATLQQATARGVAARQRLRLHRWPGAAANESEGSCGLFWACLRYRPLCKQQQRQARRRLRTGGLGAPSLQSSQSQPQHSLARAAAAAAAAAWRRHGRQPESDSSPMQTQPAPAPAGPAPLQRCRACWAACGRN